MSRNETNLMQKLVSAFIVWSMVAVSILGLFTASVGGADLQKPVPQFVPSIIDGTTVTINTNGQVENVDHSITVQNGGTLRIVNSTLNFLQDVNTTYFIDVNTNSNLELVNSTITTAASPLAMWDPLFEITATNSTLKMEEHSVLAFPGWLNVTNTLTYINDSWITSVYPDTLVTAYADDFPTFTEAMDINGDWWSGTDWAPEDFEDDCPQMIFRDCDNVTIADSRIEYLYEDGGLEVPTAFNLTFSPSVAATVPSPAGDVSNLTNLDSIYFRVLAGLNQQTLTIDAFNTLGYTDTDYQVNNVWVHALYNTSEDGISGYNGTDYVQWRVDGGIYSNLFMLEHNSPPWSENYSIPLVPTPTLSELADLDVQFDNTYGSGDGTVLFDVIELIVELQKKYTTYPTMITVDNTEMTIINSYVGADWLNVSSSFTDKNAFDLVSNSTLYLIGSSIDDDDGGLPGVPDYLEIPVGADPADYVPFRVESGSEAYYFKWADVPVVDRYGAPIPGAYVNSTFHFTQQNEINNISKINNLSGDDRPDWEYAKARVVDYLNRMYGTTGPAYNLTDTDGTVLLPLLTTYFNASNYPNGDHVGEYDIKVNYTDTSGEIVEYATCDFSPYPVSQPDDDTVYLDPIVMYGVTLPRPFGTPGLILNATTGDLAMDGGNGQVQAITDFIIVEDNATLTVSNAELFMMYTDSAPFDIIVRDNGTLVLDETGLSTQDNRAINLNLENNGTLMMTNSSTDNSVRIIAGDSSTLTLDGAEIGGVLDIIGADAAVTLNAWDTSFSSDLDDFSGDSVATLVGCYSPLSPNFQIMPSDNAEVWIYRNIEVTVYDGMTPANPLENASIWMNNSNPIASPYNINGSTDADGKYYDIGLSDYVYYNAGTMEVVESHYNGYNLATQYQYQPGAINHMETTGLGLATYPSMAQTDALTTMTVVMDEVLPDLDPPINIWPVTGSQVGRGDTVNIGSVIVNNGDATANLIDVWFNDTFMGGTQIIYSETIDTLEPNETFNISFEYTWPAIDEIGQHNISVNVDPVNNIPEQNETNNENWTMINVVAQPDLAILDYYDVSFSAVYPFVNTSFNIMANVYNLGDVAATNVLVSFYDVDNGLLGNVIVPNIAPSPTVPAVATLTTQYAASGSYHIYVVVDEANAISEVNENNNNNSVSPITPRYLRVWMNLPVNIWFVENNATGRGNPVNIGTLITNDGNQTANNVNVRFTDTFMGGSQIIYSETIATLTPGETVNVSFEYVWSSVSDLGIHNISFTVDPLNDNPEESGTYNNNWALLNVTPQSDLAILYYTDISFSEAYPLVNANFDIMANIYNLGDINATDVIVSFYDDVNGLLGNVTVADIPPSQTTPVTATLADFSYDTAGTYYISVVVDEANVISEVNENNNNNSVSPLSPRNLRVWENADLNIDVLDIIVGTDIVGYNLGGGVPVTSCDFRTMVTLRAKVWNIGELYASNVQVEFWDGGVSLGTSSIVSSITQNNNAYFMITWEATATGLSEVHTITALATGTGLTSNIATQDLTVNDNRPDMELVSAGLANGLTEVTDGETFPVNITLTNNGQEASRVKVDIYRSESDFMNTTDIQLDHPDTYMGRLGNMTIGTLAAGTTANYTINCAALSAGQFDLFIVVDQDFNKTDYVTVLNADYNLVGQIEEFDELNNNYTLAAVTVVMPELVAQIVLPGFPGNDWISGENPTIMVTGKIVRADNTNVGVSDVLVTISTSDGQTVTATSGDGGLFSATITAPVDVGNYTITVDGTNVAADTAWFTISSPGLNLMWIIIIIILIVVAVIGGITAYLYFVGLGKTVQCGECGAFIPEGAKKCPKCGVEFEDEVAKCSVCGAWVPIDVKNCPECGTEFTVGTEDLDDYEAKMKRQYDDIVRKFKQEAKADLGDEFTETEFQAWWAAQPTFITFDQWLQEEEEMKRMGSRACHNCGTENSVTAKICHKCGTVLEAEEPPKKPQGKKPQGKMPVEKKAVETPAPAESPAPPAPAPAPTPVEKSAETVGEKMSCPSCGMEVAASEKTCPICNYEFDKPKEQTRPPSGGEGGPVKRVVKKPVKRVVKRPVQKGGQ